MAIDSVIDNTDELSPEMAELYIQGSGDYKDKMILDVKAVSGLQLTNPTKLKTALDSEREIAKKATGQLKLFEGIDAVAARDALGKVKEMDGWDPEEKLNEHKKTFETQMKDKYESSEKQLRGKFDEDLKGKSSEINTLTSQLEKSMIEEASVKVITKLGGNPKLLLPHFKENLRMRKNDQGKFRVAVVNANGDDRLSPTSGKDGDMSIEELGLEMRQSDDFGEAFTGSSASGSGANHQTRTPGGNTKNRVHRISELDAKDTPKYKAAKAAADKAGVNLEIY